MNKTHSLFKKYFLILTAVILAIAFAVSGVLLLVLSKSVFVKNKYIALISVIILVVMIIFAIAVVLYFMYKRTSTTLCKMKMCADNISNGNFSQKLSFSNSTEFYQLENALIDLSDAVRKSDEIKNQFVSNVSHELRTPITSINGFVDGIIDGTIPPEQQPHYLELISEELKRLSRLTKLLLNLEQLESGAIKPVMTNVNIINIAVDILNTFEKKLNEKGLEILGLKADCSTIFADKDMIYQVMYNLIENAVKFASKNGYIEFTFREDDNYNYISVKNSGDGLSESEKQKVFNRFYRTDSSRANDTTGAGLGLNIVQSILSIHNGTISVDSIKGEYTQFTFSIPKLSI